MAAAEDERDMGMSQIGNVPSVCGVRVYVALFDSREKIDDPGILVRITLKVPATSHPQSITISSFGVTCQHTSAVSHLLRMKKYPSVRFSDLC